MLGFPFEPCLLVSNVCHDPKILSSDQVVDNLLPYQQSYKAVSSCQFSACFVCVHINVVSELIAGSLHLDDSVSTRGSNKSGSTRT
jgi:hypothetical protein